MPTPLRSLRRHGAPFRRHPRRPYSWRIIDPVYGLCYAWSSSASRDGRAQLCFDPPRRASFGYDFDRQRMHMRSIRAQSPKALRATWRWTAFWQDFLPRGTDCLRGRRCTKRRRRTPAKTR